MKHTSQNCSVLTLEATAAEADELTASLRRIFGTEPVQIERPGRSNVWIELYFPSEIQAMLAARALRDRHGVLGATVNSIEDRDWRSFWKRHFRPFRAGAALWICPSWSRRKAPEGRKAVLIHPGLSFGTGEHFTTRFCLEMLDSLSRPTPPASVIDVGTGSGILAIAASRLGAKKVMGIDNDPLAIDQARENAALNRLGRQVTFEVADIMTQVQDSGSLGISVPEGGARPPGAPKRGGHRRPAQRSGPTQSALAGRYDIVCANLFSLMLVSVAGTLVQLAKRHLVLSGIREQETDLVADVFLNAGAKEIVRDGDGEWCGLMFETRK